MLVPFQLRALPLRLTLPACGRFVLTSVASSVVLNEFPVNTIGTLVDDIGVAESYLISQKLTFPTAFHTVVAGIVNVINPLVFAWSTLNPLIAPRYGGAILNIGFVPFEQ